METAHPPQRRVSVVLGSPIDALTLDEAIARIQTWASSAQSRTVCICNAHSVVTAGQDAEFAAAIAQADMATPDGAPVAWMLRKLGAPNQQRVSGPDLMIEYLSRAAATGEPVYLYGSAPPTLESLVTRLRHSYPGLRIAGHESPPFRPLSAEEDAETVARINGSGARTVWVSLGCPKQEKWMAAHRGRVNAVMVGVGAAFDFHAGTLPRAPRWMRDNGLEWLHRLASEPGRLWKRYLVTNTLFVVGAARQLLTRG
ncbi:glycosyltransferase [Rubrivivax gelatinosus]|nr:glycosyltransferase [Rubrivivax gelatinosus]